MLSLGGRTSHGLGDHGEAVHAMGSVGRSELDLLNEQSDIDTELIGRLHLAARFWIPQALDDTGQCFIG